ncbi:MAG: peptide ABC transporter substrate-binding protein [Chloroflexota bacterium]
MAFGSFVSAQEDEEVLNILYWQAVSIMNPYLSGGTKDIEAASLVLEPLARYDETGSLVAWLAAEVPTIENGGISEDLLTITWTLQEGLEWSDGTPVTSADVVFSYDYCVTPETGCAGLDQFAGVASVEAVDDLTVVVTFEAPTPFPYQAFVGPTSPVIQAAQFADCVGAAAQGCTDQNFFPIGTGPFVVEEFSANDVVVYVDNENYRVEGQPFFDRVVFSGGGDAETAARSVLETGENDYAWNLQISPELLNNMAMDGVGTVVVSFGTSVERLYLNQTNPDPALGDDRSVYMDGENVHPFLTDPAVWQAMSMAIDREIIATELYGAAGLATCNVLPAPAAYASTANDGCLVQDIDGANAMLDEAGYADTDGDGVRETADGVPLEVLYQTSTNAVRQDTQILIQDWWSQIGISTELRNIDAGVFFGGDPASPDTYGKFYADIEMFTSSAVGTDPQAYFNNWTCGQVSGPDNNFLSGNISRWCSPEYDALLAELADTVGIEARGEISKQLNDLIVQGGSLIPLVHRGDVSAHANSLEGVRMNSWDSELWNIAEWTRTDG